GPGFRSQLADHDVQIGNHEEGGEERNALDHFGRTNAHGFQQWRQQVRESGTRIIAKRIMPKSAKIDAKLIPGEGSMMGFCGFRFEKG
nr:hypothetical protein [Tanacetum cinerariifolium]